MTRFIIRRLILSIPVLIGIVFLVFALARIIPGDPCSAALGERANAETCDRYAAEHGLDKAIVPGVFRVEGKIQLRLDEAPATLVDNQFIIYLQTIAAGEFGVSSKFGLPVTDLLIQRLPTTVELTVYALLFAIIVHQAHVNLQLADGAVLPDPDGLIEGTGKRIRHVKVRSVDAASAPALVLIVRAQLAARPAG